MRLFAVGVNHKTAPVAFRERLAVSPERHLDCLAYLRAHARLDEVVLLSTCNRVEVYAAGAGIEGEPIVDALAGLHNLDCPQLRQHCFVNQDESAARHIFRVAASLDSMVIGEPQILGQVKEAYQRAREGGTLGALLDRCLTMAFRGAKRVRTETEIARGGASVPSVAVDLARRIFGAIEGCKVAIVGAGEMAEQSAVHLRAAGCSAITVVNRSEARGRALAERVGGHYEHWSELQTLLRASDVVVTSTGAEGIVIGVDLVKSIMRSRKRAPLFAIDIAVPRDIDPRVGEIDEVFLYDIDDLQQIVGANLDARRREFELADRLLDDEVAAFLRWSRCRDVGPLIQALHAHTQAIVAAEVQRALAKLQSVSDSEKQALEHLPKTIANKLLHHPITHIRQSVSEDPRLGSEVIRSAREFFGIDAAKANASEKSR